MKTQQIEKTFVSMNKVLNEMAGELTNDLQSSKNAGDYEKLLNILEAQKIILTIESENKGFLKQAPQTQPRRAKKSTKTTTKATKTTTKATTGTKTDGKSKYEDDKYAVDTKTPHSLEEDFRFKRPHSFRFKRHYAKVTTWREMLVETCKYLYELDPKKFKAFADDESMQWGETHNFSTDKSKIRGPVLIGDSGVYVETIKDSIAVRQMIIKMLNKYDLKVESFKVYFSADYSK